MLHCVLSSWHGKTNRNLSSMMKKSERINLLRMEWVVKITPNAEEEKNK